MPTYRKRGHSWEVYICHKGILNCAEAHKNRCNDLGFAL